MYPHVRAPSAAESKELGRWLKRPRSAVQMRRGQLILFSAQGMRVQEISAALRTRARPGRPPTLTPEDESVWWWKLPRCLLAPSANRSTSGRCANWPTAWWHGR